MFELFDWNLVITLATIAVGLVGGAATVPIVDKIKATFNLSGTAAKVAAATVSTVLAIATLIVNGQISPTALTPEYLVGMVTLIWSTSQFNFERIQRKALTSAAPETID